MKNLTYKYLRLTLLTVVMMSLPFLVKGCGPLALAGLVPLLWMERVATLRKTRHFWWWHYLVFVLWNAVTTWWVANATVGGAIFAILANALQMSLVFGSFRFVKRRVGGAVPYLYLAAAWMAWEKYYLTVAEISWPWLVLGNAFADTTSLIQWYEYTGHMGGSLWVWAANLSLFGLMLAFSSGAWKQWNVKARTAALAGTVLAVFAPMVLSAALGAREIEEGETLSVIIPQPNLDPYHKFQKLSQEEQTDILMNLIGPETEKFPSDKPLLILAPETFTNDIVTSRVAKSPTFQTFKNFLSRHGNADILFGASSYDLTASVRPPHRCSRPYGRVMTEKGEKPQWITAHNSALILDSTGRYDLFHKSKLVVGTELTPYPAVFIPLENLLGGNLMAKDVGQEEITCLRFDAAGASFPVGSVICYESVYGQYCTGYVKKGAQLLAVITNDAWWGDTPGYRQHLNYARLRAIETRRYVARCANTGISAIIDPKGRILARTPWWEDTVLSGEVRLCEKETFFVRAGDIVGRVAVFLFLLLFAAALVPRSVRA